MTEVLDLRGLPPPEPLVRALEAAAALGVGEELVVLTERRPVHLLPILAERGLDVSTRELGDAHETRVRR
jgi:TusA-related sulfurtransferase